MSKEILTIVFFLVLGAGAAVYFFENNQVLINNEVVHEDEKEIASSQLASTSSPPMREGKEDVKAKPETRDVPKIAGIKNEDIRRSVESSFQHPLDGNQDKYAYERAIQSLNKDPESAIEEILKGLYSIDPKMDGTRIHLINLAMQTNASPLAKGEFIRDYLINSRFSVENGKLADDSYSAIIAIDYLAQNLKNETEVSLIVNEIMNIKNEDLKNELRERIKIYYPKLI